MKNTILYLFVVALLMSGCGKKIDRTALDEKYADSPIYSTFLEYEKKDNISGDELMTASLTAIECAGDAEDLQVTKTVEAFLKKLYEKNKENALVLAAYASSIGMIGRDDPNTANKMQAVSKSIKLIDKAVEMGGDDPNVRLTRAHFSFEMPSMLNRDDVARADYDYLIAKFEDGAFVLPDDEKSKIYSNRAELFRKEGELAKAVDCYRKVIEIGADSNRSVEAKKQIELLSE